MKHEKWRHPILNIEEFFEQFGAERVNSEDSGEPVHTYILNRSFTIRTVKTPVRPCIRTFFAIRINPFPLTDAFWSTCSKRTLKALCQNENVLMMSNFSLDSSNPFPAPLFATFSTIYVRRDTLLCLLN